MNPLAIGFLLFSIVLAGLLFSALGNFDMHWALRLFLAVLPIAATLFAGMAGLLLAALVTGAVYKASA